VLVVVVVVVVVVVMMIVIKGRHGHNARHDSLGFAMVCGTHQTATFRLSMASGRALVVAVAAAVAASSR
jgi:hypothetical protein